MFWSLYVMKYTVIKFMFFLLCYSACNMHWEEVSAEWRLSRLYWKLGSNRFHEWGHKPFFPSWFWLLGWLLYYCSYFFILCFSLWVLIGLDWIAGRKCSWGWLFQSTDTQWGIFWESWQVNLASESLLGCYHLYLSSYCLYNSSLSYGHFFHFYIITSGLV